MNDSGKNNVRYGTSSYIIHLEKELEEANARIDELTWFEEKCAELNYARIAMNNDRIGDILIEIGNKYHRPEVG